MKDKKLSLWVEILVWTPLGIILYPMYYFTRKKSSLFAISHGILMGFYIFVILDILIRVL
jgi:hypothetical protein